MKRFAKRSVGWSMVLFAGCGLGKADMGLHRTPRPVEQTQLVGGSVRSQSVNAPSAGNVVMVAPELNPAQSADPAPNLKPASAPGFIKEESAAATSEPPPSADVLRQQKVTM